MIVKFWDLKFTLVINWKTSVGTTSFSQKHIHVQFMKLPIAEVCDVLINHHSNNHRPYFFFLFFILFLDTMAAWPTINQL